MPTIQCLIPSSLMSHSDHQGTVALDAADVADALRQLVSQHPGLEPQLFDASQNLLPHIHLFVNENHVRDLGGVSTKLAAGDQLLLLTALAGG